MSTKSHPGPKLLQVGAVVAAIVVGMWGLSQLPLGPVRAWIADLGAWGPCAFVLFYAACTVLLVPPSVITVGAGALFGLWGAFLWVTVGANVGALLAFFLGRHALQERVQKKVAHYPLFNAVERAIPQQGWWLVLLLRLSPLFPFTLLNYSLGLTKIPWPQYALATFLGMLPGTFLFVYLGTLGENQRSGPVAELARWLGIAASLFVALAIARLARKILRQRLY